MISRANARICKVKRGRYNEPFSCAAHLPANRQHYNDSVVLYERACAGYSAVLGKGHPIIRACRQHYSDILTSQEQDGLARPPEIPNNSGSIHTGTRSELSRGLAKITIKGSNLSRKQ